MPDAVTSALVSTDLPALFQTCEDFDHLLLAVSGGVDSVALMVLVDEWRRLGGSGCEIRVLTVDHGLRPEAAMEAKAVVEIAAKLGLAGETLTWKGQIPQSGIQEAARQLRYELLLGRAAELRQGAARVALVTAHHQDDLAETVLMRLARGAGVDGLAAMRSISNHESGVAIVRPLLGIAKARLRATLEARRQSWIEDPSNCDQRFERARLREAKAATEELGLSAAPLSRTAGRMVRAREALEWMVDQSIAPHLVDPRLTQFGVFVWSRECHEPPDEIGIRMLLRVLRGVGGRDEPLQLLKVERMYERLHESEFAGGTLGNCVLAPVGGGISEPRRVAIYREPKRGVLPEIVTDLAAPLSWDNRFEIRASRPLTRKVMIRSLNQRDLTILRQEAEIDRLGVPTAALFATPVIEDENGSIRYPASNVHDRGAKQLLDTTLNCRFLVERLGKF